MRTPVDASLDSGWEIVAVVGLFLGLFVLLAYLLPGREVLVLLSIASMATVYYAVSLLVVYNGSRLPDWTRTVPVWLTFLLPFTITTVLILHFWAAISPLTFALVIALLAVFFYYWFVVPLALYQKVEQQREAVDVEEWPALSVLVPAYDEEGYVGACIDALLDVDYPREKLEVIVIDDGSTDGTFAEARRHATERVTVLRKENGGKHSALNHGLGAATADRIVTIDADSLIAADALRDLMGRFEAHPDAGAVAGNVKVANRGSLVTDLQALEYIIGINTFRRAFDLLGVVTVVPGCLGVFRRDVLERIGGYEADTLTEDFDATIRILKRGEQVRHSDALVYTEVPDTWGDLYRQRLRWFRGNLQTVFKHYRVIVDGTFGLLHRIAFPYVLFSMSILPALGLVVLGLVVWMVVRGSYWQVGGMFAFFAALHGLLSVLAIRIDDDDLWLSRYAPFSVIGYKQFLDAVLLKSLVDVLSGRELPWTRARRRRQRAVPSSPEASSGEERASEDRHTVESVRRR